MLTMGLAVSAAPASAAKDDDNNQGSANGSAQAYDHNDPGGGGSAAPNSGGEAPPPVESGGAEYGSSTGRTSSTPEYPVVNGYRAKLLPDGKAAAPAGKATPRTTKNSNAKTRGIDESTSFVGLRG
jgi:hypothetical protein